VSVSVDSSAGCSSPATGSSVDCSSSAAGSSAGCSSGCSVSSVGSVSDACWVSSGSSVCCCSVWALVCSGSLCSSEQPASERAKTAASNKLIHLFIVVCLLSPNLVHSTSLSFCQGEGDLPLF